MPSEDSARAKTCRTDTPEQKEGILREHLIQSTPVSDLGDKHGLHPTLFCQWRQIFLKRELPLLKPDDPPLGIWATWIENSKPFKITWPGAAKLWPDSGRNMCV